MERRDAERRAIMEEQQKQKNAENEAKRAEKQAKLAEAKKREEYLLLEHRRKFEEKERQAEQ